MITAMMVRSPPWPERADGNGSSLELRYLPMDIDDAESWQPSVDFGGSPGRDGAILSAGVATKIESAIP